MKDKFFTHFYPVLGITGVIILISINLGIAWHINNLPKIPKVKIKNASANISESIKNGIDINIDNEIVKLSGEDIARWTEYYVRDYSGKKDARINTYKILEYISNLAPTINSEPADAKFELVASRVNVIQPAIPGKQLDIHGSVFALASAIRNGRDMAYLVIDNVEPTITPEKINTLGINTLLGRGESNFTGSSSSRTHNIKVGMARFNGIILKPGEKFSFNKTLGGVDGRSGYQAELVIKNGKLLYEYGGGICQVSTTLFRSVIYAGLPIIERSPHSFPVKYYSPQGFDATIYPEIKDLKFVNDTPNHILIQNKVEGTKLIFEIYGSNNGRIVTIQGPFQYDQKKNGSMKAYFTRSIAYIDSTKREERFDSVYKAPFKAQERNPLE